MKSRAFPCSLALAALLTTPSLRNCTLKSQGSRLPKNMPRGLLKEPHIDLCSDRTAQNDLSHLRNPPFHHASKLKKGEFRPEPRTDCLFFGVRDARSAALSFASRCRRLSQENPRKDDFPQQDLAISPSLQALNSLKSTIFHPIHQSKPPNIKPGNDNSS